MLEHSETPTAPHHDEWQPSRISQVAYFVLAGGAAASVFLAGGPQEASLAIFLLMAGAALIALPPKAGVETKRWLVAGALVFAASLALLPQSWLGAPAWRASLAAAGVPLASSISPMPNETMFWLAILGITAIVVLFILAHPMRSAGVLAVAAGCVGVCGAYAALALFCHKSGWEFPFDSDPAEFGFFRNRNHTSAFLVTGCVLALGVLGVAYRGKHWIAGSVAALSLALSLIGLLFFTTSRGGIFALVGGSLLWLAGLGSQHRSKPLLASFGAVFLAGVFLFLAPQSVVKKRMLAFIGAAKTPAETSEVSDGGEPLPAEEPCTASDPRVRIFSDTLQLIHDFPLTGTGLGTFRWVFPQYRKSLHTDSPVVHPESDWLMLAAEAGIPAVAVFFFGVGSLVRSAWRQRRHPYWPLRWGLLCAAISALLHGFVDVPAHRPALGWWILVIAAAGVQTPPRVKLRPSRWQHAVFVLCGIGAVALGVFLLRAQWFGGRAPASIVSWATVPDVIRLRVEGHPNESADAARAAIRDSPMAGQLYFHLGLALLQIEGQAPEADRIFRAQALLQPFSATLLIEQAAVRMEREPLRAATLCAEAIALQERIDSHRLTADQIAPVRFREILALAEESPALQHHLLVAMARQPEKILAILERATPEVATSSLSSLTTDQAFLKQLTTSDQTRFLQTWYRHGDREKLFAFLDSHADWEQSAWPIQMRRLVDAGKHEEATHATAQRYAVRLELPEPGSDKTAPPPRDLTDSVGAFLATWRSGNTVSARRLLEEARSAKPVPPEIWRLSAALAASDGQWNAAWSHLSLYIRDAHLDRAY